MSAFEHLLVREGDIILAMDRPVISTGLKVARVVKSDLPSVLVQRVMRFDTVKTELADYLLLCILHPAFRNFLSRDGMTGSDLPHITGTGVAEYPIPLPPLDERREIVARVDKLMRLADLVEHRLSTCCSSLRDITTSALAKAFRGELVPTEAELARQEGRDYEPASALLERIRAEREAQGAKAPAKKRRRRRASR